MTHSAEPECLLADLLLRGIVYEVSENSKTAGTYLATCLLGDGRP